VKSAAPPELDVRDPREGRDRECEHARGHVAETPLVPRAARVPPELVDALGREGPLDVVVVVLHASEAARPRSHDAHRPLIHPANGYSGVT
jgi:hypothetical protein